MKKSVVQAKIRFLCFNYELLGKACSYILLKYVKLEHVSLIINILKFN